MHPVWLGFFCLWGIFFFFWSSIEKQYSQILQQMHITNKGHLEGFVQVEAVDNVVLT